MESTLSDRLSEDAAAHRFPTDHYFNNDTGQALLEKMDTQSRILEAILDELRRPGTTTNGKSAAFTRPEAAERVGGSGVDGVDDSGVDDETAAKLELLREIGGMYDKG